MSEFQWLRLTSKDPGSIPGWILIFITCTICTITTHLSILPPLLHNSVEEGQSVDQGLESWMGAATLQSSRRNLEIRVAEVQLQTIGRLSHHFQ